MDNDIEALDNNNKGEGDNQSVKVVYRSINSKGKVPPKDTFLSTKPPNDSTISSTKPPKDAVSSIKPSKDTVSSKDTTISSKKPRIPVTKPKPVALTIDSRTRAEVEILKKRYKRKDGSGFKVTNSIKGSILELVMPVEDPDFPFDLPSISLQIILPVEYPKAGAFPKFIVLNENIPKAIQCRIQNRMDEHSEKLTCGEPIIKDLLRLLDRNLEKWMVALPIISSSGSSVKIIHASSIVVSPSPNHATVTDTTNTDASATLVSLENVTKSLEFIKVGIPIKKEQKVHSRFLPPEHLKFEPITASAKAGTIQIELNNLKLENIGLIIPIQLGISLGCNRCHNTTTVMDLRPDSDRTVPCSSCKQYMTISYFREAIHENNQRLGYLRIKRCDPIDLLPCCYQITCGACTLDDTHSPLDSSIKVERVQIGERLVFPCRNCQASCILLYEGVAWTRLDSLTPSTLTTKGAIDSKASRLPTKIGEPLPDYGTCSHYRKSHRWFRFPCCGRAYPCDECHSDDLTNKGHTPEWANRQICGYCSREFSTAQKYCACGETPGEASRRSAHWEGGKGTRDQNLMSRKDKKKYRSQEKTISTKAKASLQQSK